MKKNKPLFIFGFGAFVEEPTEPDDWDDGVDCITLFLPFMIKIFQNKRYNTNFAGLQWYPNH